MSSVIRLRSLALSRASEASSLPNHDPAQVPYPTAEELAKLRIMAKREQKNWLKGSVEIGTAAPWVLFWYLLSIFMLSADNWII